MNTLHSLTVLAATEGEEKAAEGIASLGLNLGQIAFQAGVFVVLFVLIRKFAFKKITEVLDERHMTIEKGLADAEKIGKQLADSEVQVEAMMKQARTDADSIVSKAQQETGMMIKAAEEKATAKSDKIAEDAHARIEADIQKAKKDLKTEMASLVAEATEAVIGEKMDSATDKKLIERMLK